jgi:hypothetical protein
LVKRKINKKPVLMKKGIFVVFILLLFQEASSQDNSLVSYEIEDVGKVKAGDTIDVRITLNVLSGWFIYAPTAGNRLQGVQMMSLKFTSPSNVLQLLGDVKMPESRLNKSYDVFMGEGNVFYQRVIIKENASGVHNVTAELKYQACSSNICYPPVTEKIGIDINIEKPALSAKQVVQNATQLAKKEIKMLLSCSILHGVYGAGKWTRP